MYKNTRNNMQKQSIKQCSIIRLNNLDRRLEMHSLMWKHTRKD